MRSSRPAKALGVSEKAIRKSSGGWGWPATPVPAQIALPIPAPSADPNLSGPGAGSDEPSGSTAESTTSHWWLLPTTILRIAVGSVHAARRGRTQRACPCGSGRKYKTCCLEAGSAALQSSELDVAGMVNEAIETDDWSPLDGLVDTAMRLFEAGQPLEHIRFRDHMVLARPMEPAEITHLCGAGWMRRAEYEIAHVIADTSCRPRTVTA